MPKGQYERKPTQGDLQHAEDAQELAERAVQAAQPDPIAVENAEVAVDLAEQAQEQLGKTEFTEHPFGDQTFPGAQSIANADSAFTVDPKTGKVTGRQ
jgi:hypothetical protein